MSVFSARIRMTRAFFKASELVPSGIINIYREDAAAFGQLIPKRFK